MIVTNFYSVSFDKINWANNYDVTIDDEMLLTENLKNYVFSDNEAAEYFLNQISPSTHYISALPMPWHWSLSGHTLDKALELFNHWIDSPQPLNNLTKVGSNFGTTDIVFYSDVNSFDWTSRLNNIEEYDKIVSFGEMLLEKSNPKNDRILSSIAYIMMYLGNTDFSIRVYAKIDTSNFNVNIPHESFAIAMSMIQEKKIILLPMLQKSILPKDVPISTELKNKFTEYIKETMFGIFQISKDKKNITLDEKAIIRMLSISIDENDEKIVCDFIRAVIVYDDELLDVVNYILQNKDIGYSELGAHGKEIIRHHLVNKFVNSDQSNIDMYMTIAPEYNERYEKLIKLFFKEKNNVRSSLH